MTRHYRISPYYLPESRVLLRQFEITDEIVSISGLIKKYINGNIIVGTLTSETPSQISFSVRPDRPLI